MAIVATSRACPHPSIYGVSRARAPLVSLPWRDSFARACKFDLGVRGRGQQPRFVWGGAALDKNLEPFLKD